MSSSSLTSLTSVLERERRIVTLALRLASTYCDVAESHAKLRHRADTQRVLQKARKEIVAVERRLTKNTGLFAIQTDNVLAQVEEIKKRIEVLAPLAA